jgi:hypothetical protein
MKPDGATGPLPVRRSTTIVNAEAVNVVDVTALPGASSADRGLVAAAALESPAQCAAPNDRTDHRGRRPRGRARTA